MILARVVGKVVATAKDQSLVGKAFVMCRPLLTAATDSKNDPSAQRVLVAVDLVGAPEGSIVMINTGSAAKDMSGAPVDAVVAGIVDRAEVAGRRAPIGTAGD